VGRKSTTSEVLNIPVDFGGVSIGNQTCRLGLKISRSVIAIDKADEAFCGHRLQGYVVLSGKDDGSGQQTVVNDLHHTVRGAFDVKRIGVDSENISTGLTFSLRDVDVSELAKFSKGSGRLVIQEIHEIPADAPSDEEKNYRPLPGQKDLDLEADEPWRGYLLKNFPEFTPAILKALGSKGFKTVGELAAYTEAGNRLIDIDGIGPGAGSKIIDALERFHSEKPWETKAAAK
jgi:hypothetical protein